MEPIRARLDLTPEDAVRFFAAKGEQLAWDHTEVWGEANVHAFTVAKATTLEVLRTIRAEVERAVGAGQTFEDFKKRLKPRLETLGWWGRKEVLDGDTGELTQAQLGSVRRLRTIYQANVQTAYMAGGYKRYLANVADRPYWLYVAVMDGRTRPAHAALNGKVWRWDDPIWAVIWPPNGWGCRCRIVALTEAEFQALGVKLEDGSAAIVSREVAINRDGDLATVQGVRYTDGNGKPGVFYPDPGWDYNPGAAWARFDPKGDVPDCTWGGTADFTEPGKTCLGGVPGQKTWKEYGRPALRDVPLELRLPMPAMLARAADRGAAVELLAQALGVSQEAPLRVVKTPVDEVALRYEWLAHVVEKDADARERYANFILPTLESPFEVWLAEYPDGFRHRYVGLFAELGVLAIVRVNQDGSLLWNLMMAREPYLNKQRAGLLRFGK